VWGAVIFLTGNQKGCSGEEQPPAEAVLVWGAVICWIKKSGDNQKPHSGDRTVMRLLTRGVLNPPIYATTSALVAAVLNAATLLVRLGVDINDDAAFGIFSRFQIPDIDFCFALFSLCHLFFLTYLFFGLFIWVVSVTPKSI